MLHWIEWWETDISTGYVRATRHFSTPKPPKPPSPPPPPDTGVTGKASEEAAGRARLEAKRKRGRAATILTSPVGAGLGDIRTGGNPTLGT